MKAGALAELTIPRLELLRGFVVLHDRVDPRANLLHLLEVRFLESSSHRLDRALFLRDRPDPLADAPAEVRPAVLHEIDRGAAAGLVGREVFKPAALPALRRDFRKPGGIDRAVGP